MEASTITVTEWDGTQHLTTFLLRWGDGGRWYAVRLGDVVSAAAGLESRDDVVLQPDAYPVGMGKTPEAAALRLAYLLDAARRRPWMTGPEAQAVATKLLGAP